MAIAVSLRWRLSRRRLGSRSDLGPRRRLVVRAGFMVVWAGLLAMLSGCIGPTAGYGEVRRTVSRRMPEVELRWDRHEGEEAIPKAWQRETLSSDRAARWAVWRHPKVQGAFAELGIARAALAGALRLPNPNLEASLGFAGEDLDPSVELDLTVSLTSLLNLANRERAGQSMMDAGKAHVVQRSVEVAYAARRAFVEAVAAEQTLALQKTNLAAAVASAEAAAALLEAGNVPRLVLVNEQAMVEELRISVSDAEANALLRKQRLAAALGLRATEVLPPLPKALDEMPEQVEDMKALAALAHQQSLQLAQVKAQYAAAAARADAATLRAWLPHLEAGVTLDREEGQWGVGPVVGMAIPLFDQGQGPIGIAEAQMDRAAAEHRRVRVMLDRAIKGAVTRLAVRRAQVRQFRDKLLPLRASVLDETLLQYNAMSLGVFQLLQARRDQIRAQVAFIGVLRGYHTAHLDLEQLSKGAMPPDAGALSTLGFAAGGGAQDDH